MCAATRLSLMSAVCVPVKSILKIVAVKLSAVCAVFRTKSAVPNEAGRGAPPTIVGTTGGFSAELLRSAWRKISARALDRVRAKTRAPRTRAQDWNMCFLPIRNQRPATRALHKPSGRPALLEMPYLLHHTDL